MIYGTLSVTLDPPYMGFNCTQEVPARVNGTCHHCTTTEIRDLFQHLGWLLPHESWSPKECVVHQSLTIPLWILRQFKLVTFSPADRVTDDSDTSVQAVG